MTTRREHSQLSAALVLLCFVLVALVGCKEEPPTSLYDPNAAAAPTPSITAITPPSGTALAGVTVVTITGANFSPVIQNNYVYFDASLATVLQASSTELKVSPPNVVKDSIKVRVAVVGSVPFSNTVLYKLKPAAADFGGIESFEVPYGIACDNTGNVYISIISRNVGVGVKKITPNGVRSDFSPAFSSSVNKWNGMKVGSGGFMYALARNAIFRIPMAGGNAAAWTANVIPNPGLVNDLDFDASGNIWVGGSGSTVFSRVRVSDKNVKSFSFKGDVRSIRVYNGYVYLGGLLDSVEGVWRFRIVSPDSIDAREEYFNLTSVYGAGKGSVYAVTFAADGDMYIGTDHADGVLVVHPGKNSEPLYPGVLQPRSLAFAWDTGPYLYVSRNGGIVNSVSVTNSVVKIDVQKTSAPYYGWQ